ncbi:hypothetical protein J3R30DRAFT_3698409 [Lentinula aciculospora]|uniref:F-box domain-containing protein n=1 Tax=Lentinula aciculospora TaxID=153920 RepID=A0A9W9AIH3_9AGAR|nr:hypothetical protein J3R30DRAFT_3698409 [Lentinula aciculospora]
MKISGQPSTYQLNTSLVTKRDTSHYFKGQFSVSVAGAMLAPIYNLPNEMLFEIFSQCLASENPRHLQILLIHVCRQWRQVAMSSPSLWTDLRWRPTAELGTSLPRIWSISRTLRFPLAFTTKPSSFHPLLPSNAVTDFSTSMLRYSVFFSAPHLAKFTNTREARIGTHVGSSNINGIAVDTLRRGIGTTYPVVQYTIQLDFTVNQLRGRSGSEYRRLTTAVPQPLISNDLVFPFLQLLKLNIYKKGWAGTPHFECHLLRSITAPALRTLKLHHTNDVPAPWYQDDLGVDVVLSFQLRSLALLEELVLHGVPIPSEEKLEKPLLILPALTRLTYNSSSFDIVILLELLQYKNESPPLLPALTYLEFDLRHEICLSCLADMIESRWWPNKLLESSPSGKYIARLEHIHISRDNGCFYLKIAVHRINVCRDQGFCLDGAHHIDKASS